MIIKLLLSIGLISLFFYTVAEVVELKQSLSENSLPDVISSTVTIFMYLFWQVIIAIGLIFNELLEMNKRFESIANMENEQLDAGQA